MLKRLSLFHQSKNGLLVFGITELIIAYGFASLAIDRGNLWLYLLMLIFLVGSLQNLFKLIGKFIHDKEV